ncbi:hypothetical protein ES288_D13G029800v1 [Gossypium darwinii]|uniref:Uncharacterized protein n=1 Tax=Gossypium darwinii TaxID=34276 RepID=A0A5D1ZV63_GOSDA|nr:hypothetical protein ES288_D13G029800v1 [Gossypium darwinii]
MPCKKKKTMNACFLKIWASESADITLGILKQTLCIKKLRRYGLSGSPMFKSCYVGKVTRVAIVIEPGLSFIM